MLKYKRFSVRLNPSKMTLRSIFSGFCTALVLLPSLAAAQRPDPRFDENEGGSSASSPHHRERIFHPLILDRGIRIEDHPNDLWQHGPYAPEMTVDCHPDNFNAPCARILWDMERPAEPGERYIARVPGLVRLYGPKKDVWWAPFIHCLAYDPERGAQELSPPGVICQSVPDSYIQQMSWTVGGQIEGLDATPGLYEGSIPLLIRNGDMEWEMMIPVTYELFPKIWDPCPTVAFNSASISFFGLPEKTGGTVTIHADRANGRLELKEGYDTPEIHRTAQGRLASFNLTGYTSGTNVDIQISKTKVNGQEFTSQIGHYNSSGVWEVIRSSNRGYAIDEDDIYWDRDGQALMILGGGLTVPSGWAAGTYTGDINVNISCVP